MQGVESPLRTLATGKPKPCGAADVVWSQLARLSHLLKVQESL